MQRGLDADWCPCLFDREALEADEIKTRLEKISDLEREHLKLTATQTLAQVKHLLSLSRSVYPTLYSLSLSLSLSLPCRSLYLHVVCSTVCLSLPGLFAFSLSRFLSLFSRALQQTERPVDLSDTAVVIAVVPLCCHHRGHHQHPPTLTNLQKSPTYLSQVSHALIT